MNTIAEHIVDRDRFVLSRLRQAADSTRMCLREWIQAELRDARVQLQILEATAKGSRRAELAERVNRVNDIDRRQLRAVELAFEAAHREAATEPAALRARLEEALSPYERIARELWELRAVWREAIDAEAGQQET